MPEARSAAAQPIGVQTLAHPEAELASARAAASVGLPYVASSAASHTCGPGPGG